MDKNIRLIYLHGLGGLPNGEKGKQLHNYCQMFYPNVRVVRPDLNLPPPQAMDLLDDLMAEPTPAVVMGLSLGGFFALKMHERYGCPTVLLNPSVHPHQSLLRFFPQDNPQPNDVGHTTEGGWQVKWSDIQWFADNPAPPPQHPERCLLLVQTGDTRLDYREAVAHCTGVNQIIEEGGDHRISNFPDKIPQLLSFLFPK